MSSTALKPDIVLNFDNELTRLAWRFSHKPNTKGQAFSMIQYFEQSIPRKSENFVLLDLPNSTEILESPGFVKEYGNLSPDYLANSIIPRTISSLDFGIDFLAEILPDNFYQQRFDTFLYGICRSYQGLAKLRTDIAGEITILTGNNTRYQNGSLRYSFFTHRLYTPKEGQIEEYLERTSGTLNSLFYSFSIWSPWNATDESPI